MKHKGRNRNNVKYFVQMEWGEGLLVSVMLSVKQSVNVLKLRGQHNMCLYFYILRAHLDSVHFTCYQMLGAIVNCCQATVLENKYNFK